MLLLLLPIAASSSAALESCPVNRSAWVPPMNCPASATCCNHPAGASPCTHGPTGKTPCAVNGSWAPGRWGCTFGNSCCQSGVGLEPSRVRPNCLIVGDSVANGIFDNGLKAWGDCQTQLIVGLNAQMERECWNVTSLSRLATDMRWDVIQINEGLHSLSVNTSADQTQWGAQLGDFIDTIRATNPQAKLIYATMTPMMAELYEPAFAGNRQVVEQLNAVAVKTARAHKVDAINDLYKVVLDACGGKPYVNCSLCDDESKYHPPDFKNKCGFHYSAAGWKLLGDTVRAAMKAQLPPAAAPSASAAAAPASPVPQRLPPHGWETVGQRVFAHLAKREGPLNASDAAFLARFSMVAFEKPQDEAHVGWAEDKMDAAARAVKAVRPDVWALRYINSLLDFTGAETNFSLHEKAAAAGLLWPPFHNNFSTFNVVSPAMRQLLVEECLNSTDKRGGPFDGCFIDRANFGKQLEAQYRENGRTPAGFTPKMVVDLAAAQPLLLSELQSAVGPDRLILAKEHGGLAGYGDGKYVNSLMMNDGLCSRYAKIDVDTWFDPAVCLAQMEASAGAVSRNQLLQARAMGDLTGPTGDGNFTFTLAAFLAVAGDSSFFSYASNSAHNSYEMGYTPWRAEYDWPLGKPLGLADRSGANRSTFARRFASGTNVSVDVLRGCARIDWSHGERSIAGGCAAGE